MAGELGLQFTFKEKVIEPLRTYRGSDGVPGKEIDLEKFMQTRLNLTTSKGAPLTLDHLFADMGLDPERISLDNLLTLSNDYKYLAPEVIRQFVVKGMDLNVNYKDLIAASENAGDLVVTSPWIDYENPKLLPVAEAESIPTSKFSWGYKTVRLSKKARALEWSDELILSVKLPVAKHWLQRVGVELGALLYADAIATLVSGDQSTGSDTCAVVGVANSGTLTFADFVTLWVRSRLISQNWGTLVTSEKMANALLALEEFKPTTGGLGAAAVNLESRNRVIPNNLPHLVSSNMDDDQILMLDPAQAMIQLTFRPLMVESDRIVMRQISGTAVSVLQGFATTERMARIILDKSVAFSTNGFPTWMTPLT
jgi:hypothetical protein